MRVLLKLDDRHVDYRFFDIPFINWVEDKKFEVHVHLEMARP